MVQSKLMIIPAKVLCSMLHHSTSADESTQEMEWVHSTRALGNLSVFVKYLLSTIEMMVIPASDIPVKNLMMTNITYDVEKALSAANTMVVT